MDNLFWSYFSCNFIRKKIQHFVLFLFYLITFENIYMNYSYYCMFNLSRHNLFFFFGQVTFLFLFFPVFIIWCFTFSVPELWGFKSWSLKFLSQPLVGWLALWEWYEVSLEEGVTFHSLVHVCISLSQWPSIHRSIKSDLYLWGCSSCLRFTQTECEAFWKLKFSVQG